jgi:predicted regulator of Ras-like GTPase activity (Roadblock/LC7/MglB family)
VWKEDHMSRMEELNALLSSFHTSTPDIEGSAVITNDGLIITSHLPASMEEERVAAMAAAMLSLGDRTASELQRGSLEQVYVQGDSGYVLLRRATSEALVLVLTTKKAKLGLVFLDVGRLVTGIADVL